MKQVSRQKSSKKSSDANSRRATQEDANRFFRAAADSIKLGERVFPLGANTRQVGGGHYKTEIQHWDYVVANDLDYFQGQITKYVTRWRKKNGLQDLQKARHFLDKYIEVETKASLRQPR